MSIRVLLADDHTVMRDGLRALLEQEMDVTVVGVAENGRQAVQRVEVLQPEVVLMDITMPELNGMEATRRIRSRCPGVKVIALTMHTDPQYVTGMLEAGATGYLLKNTSIRNLIQAIRDVLDCRVVISPEVQLHAVNHNSDMVSADAASGLLTDREREVLKCIAEGLQTDAIAATLNLSINTVAKHRQHIMEKLHLHTIADLTKYAIREGLISVSGNALTDREREVLQLLAEGKSTIQIAEKLCVDINTIAKHRKNIMEKLRLDNIADLTKYALREGWTSLE